MNLRKLLLIVVSLGILAGLSACKKNVSVLVFDTPVEQGSASIVIKTTRTDGLSLSGYTLEITGPVSKTETVNSDTYTLENAVAGTYQVRASKTNFIGTVNTVTVLAIEDGKTFAYNVNLSLTEKRAPVTINNATGGTITVPSANSGGTGIGGNSTTVVIPPNAIPGGGTTQISITPIPTNVTNNQATTPTGGLAGFSFLMEPSGLVFLEPITLNIPLDIPANVSQNVPFFMIYRLPDGNFSTDPNDKVPVTVNAQGTSASVQISHFSEWVLGTNVEIIESTPVQVVFTYPATTCQGSFSQVFIRTALMGPVTSSISGIGQTTFSVEASIQYPAKPNTTYRPVVSYFERTYTLRNLDNGTDIESYTLPQGPISSVSGESFCHNSGGG